MAKLLKDVWQAADGAVFPSEKEAQDHEVRCREAEARKDAREAIKQLLRYESAIQKVAGDYNFEGGLFTRMRTVYTFVARPIIDLSDPADTAAEFRPASVARVTRIAEMVIDKLEADGLKIVRIGKPLPGKA